MKTVIGGLTYAFIKLTFIPNINLLIWMFIAIAVDFVTGVAKAKVKKIERTSTGMRQTIIKLLQYIGVIAGVVILGNVLNKENPMMSYVNDFVIVFIIYIEVKSVFENLYEMDQQSPVSRFFFKPMLAMLSLGLEKMPLNQINITNAGSATNASQVKDVITTELQDAITKSDGLPKSILVIVACLSLFSCKIPQRSTSSSVTDSTIINYKPVDTTIKGGQVQTVVNIDSLMDEFNRAIAASGNDNDKLMKALNALKRPVIINDTAGKVQLSYWMDAAGKLQVSCASKDETIKFLIAEVNRIRSEKKTETIHVYRAPWYTWAFLGTAILSLVLLALAFAFRKR